MFKKIQKLVAPPTFADDELKTRTARLLNTTLFLMIAISLVMVPYLYLTTSGSIYTDPSTFLIGVVTVTLSIALMFALRRGHVQLTGIFLSLNLYGIAVVNAIFFGGVGSSNMVVFALTVAAAGLFLGGRGASGFCHIKHYWYWLAHW
ncbi:MAG: hypothetical protein H6669_13585 [Ardenticatenaceae bacterium]|nr:hypothetical protein [Ardenticatenaceae bacterium]